MCVVLTSRLQSDVVLFIHVVLSLGFCVMSKVEGDAWNLVIRVFAALVFNDTVSPTVKYYCASSSIAQ